MSDKLFAEASNNGAPTRPLPRPARERWQPLRSGVLNIFKFDEEEFLFEDGRLLLRGNNGAGKSRVLALQLPFLLDGEMASHRVEPDADPAKRMEWNLLMNKHENRLGYTWIEFGRRDADGREHFLTIGCGMHARKGTGIPPAARWFFVTPRRVGEAFSIANGLKRLWDSAVSIAARVITASLWMRRSSASAPATSRLSNYYFNSVNRKSCAISKRMIFLGCSAKRCRHSHRA